jgi:hypothetical protein
MLEKAIDKGRGAIRALFLFCRWAERREAHAVPTRGRAQPAGNPQSRLMIRSGLP